MAAEVLRRLAQSDRMIFTRVMSAIQGAFPRALKVVAGRVASRTLVLIFAVVLLWFEFLPPIYSVRLDPKQINPEIGRALLVPSPKFVGEPLIGWRSDTASEGAVSEISLLENGRPLGPGHVSHDQIRSEGRGFSHWYKNIYFAPSGDGGPGTREYVVRGPLRLNGLLQIFLLGIVVLGALRERAVRRTSVLAYNAGKTAVQALAAQVEDRLVGYRLPTLSPVVGYIAGAAIGFALYLGHLFAVLTAQNGLAGMIQISDAAGYLNCANELIDFGGTESWCHRRPMYSTLFAGLSLLANRNIEIALMMQAALIGACLYAALRECARWLGLGVTIVAAVFAFRIAWVTTFGQTLSEGLGIMLGLLATACLLRAAQTRSLVLAAGGLLLVSAGLGARPAAIFALPTLLLWFVYLAIRTKVPLMRALALGVGGIACGYSVHFIELWALGATAGGSFGNFSQVIYGLSVDGDWRTIFQHHPELSADDTKSYNAIYALAWHNITARPDVFVSGVWKNAIVYIDRSSLLFGLPEFPRRALFVMGLVGVLLQSRRSMRAALVGAVALGELFSATLIGRDAEQRVWVATFFLGQLLPVLSTVRALAWFALGPKGAENNQFVPDARMPAILGISALLAVLSTLPFTPLRAIAASTYEPTSATCPKGQTKIVTTINRGGALLKISAENVRPTILPREISVKDLKAGMPHGSWYGEDIAKLDAVTLYMVSTEAPALKMISFLSSSPEMSVPTDERIVVCASREGSPIIASNPYLKIVSYERVPR